MTLEPRRLAWMADWCETASIRADDFDILSQQSPRLGIWHQQCLGEGQDVDIWVRDQYAGPN